MTKSIKRRTVSGLIWSTFGKFSINGTNFIIGIILARLLSPEDFGITGIILILIAVSRVFVEGGFSKALIQNQNNTELEYSTVFYTNLFVSVILYSILFLSAPYIAKFYESPILKDVTRVSALAIIFVAFSIVPRAQLTIKIDFKTQNLITLFAVVLSGAVGIFLAYRGFGVWALVYMSILRTLIVSIILTLYIRWIPSLNYSNKLVKRFFGYSAKILLGDIINIIYHDFLIIVVGKIYGANILGYYTRAKTFGDSSSLNMSQIIQSVSFPILCSLQDNRITFINAARKFLRLSVFITLPVSSLFYIFAEEIIIILLTEKWLFSVSLLKIMALISLFYPIIHINQSLLNANGNSKLYLYSEISKIAMVLVAISLTYKYSIETMIWGQLVAIFFTYLFSSILSWNAVGYGLIEQVKDILPILTANFFTGLSVFFMSELFDLYMYKVVIGTILYLFIYLLIALSFRFDELNELKRILSKK